MGTFTFWCVENIMKTQINRHFTGLSNGQVAPVPGWIVRGGNTIGETAAGDTEHVALAVVLLALATREASSLPLQKISIYALKPSSFVRRKIKTIAFIRDSK